MNNKGIIKGLAGFLGAGVLAFGMGGNVEGGTEGYLEIENNLNSASSGALIYRDDSGFPEARDDYDDYDINANSMPFAYPNCYSDIVTYRLGSDVRAEDSVAPYNIKLSFEGMLLEGDNRSNWLEFSFPYDSYGNYEFNGSPILLQETNASGDAIGPYFNVREIIDNHAGRLDLADVPAGSYSQWTPYAHFVLDIGGNTIQKLLGDANLDRVVDDKDASIMALNWLNRTGDATWSQGDFNNDGNVDCRDASIFASHYGQSVEGMSGGVDVPEPTGLEQLLGGAIVVGMGLGVGGLMRRRKQRKQESELDSECSRLTNGKYKPFDSLVG